MQLLNEIKVDSIATITGVTIYTNSRLRATAFQTQAYPENKWFNPEPNRFKIRLQ